MKIHTSFTTDGSHMSININMPTGTPESFQRFVKETVEAEVMREVYRSRAGSSIAAKTFRKVNAQFALALVIAKLGVPHGV